MLILICFVPYSENKSFKVYVVLPLFPAFDNQNAIAAVQYYNLRSIKFGEFSIYNELIRAGLSDPSKYITFHGMRNWTVLMGQLTQEIIYVHSKLMIVDDTFVICGSANINDRSMLGSRDSELACLVKDEEFEFSEMNGRFVKVGKYASSLRKKIFKLHLGIYYENPNKISVMDCASDKFFDFFKKVSAQNTRIYEDCFKCLPSNEAKTFAAQSEYINQSKLVKSDPHKVDFFCDTISFQINKLILILVLYRLKNCLRSTSVALWLTSLSSLWQMRAIFIRVRPRKRAWYLSLFGYKIILFYFL